MADKKRLGRGLNALLGDSVVTAEMDETENKPSVNQQPEIPLEQIEVNPMQPRRDFDEIELKKLSESLQSHGMLQPVLVRNTDRGFQLIAGERRLRAAKEAGWQSVPVQVVNFNDQQVFEATLIENMQRADLNPIEKAQGFQDYMNRYQVTQEELAQKVKLDRSTISNLVRLLELPPAVQDAVRVGQISSGHARALLSLEDPDKQALLCQQIIGQGLSVRAVENLVKQSRESEPKASTTTKPEKTAHVQSIEDELRQKLATKVLIRLQSEEKGQIVIDFETNDDFERIMSMLR